MAWNKYPYTDNHELNLDWFLEQFKLLLSAWDDLQAAWAAYKEDLTGEWEEVEAAWQRYKTYIDVYFANLNVQTEINNKIDSMVTSGEFLNVISPTVVLQTTAETSRWLAEHITQETGYVLDTSLTVAGAAADSAAVGNKIVKKLIPLMQNDNRYMLQNLSWSQGGFSMTTGYNQDLQTYIRVPDTVDSAIPIKGYSKLIITIPDGYALNAFFFNSDLTKNSIINDTSVSGYYDIDPDAEYVRFSLHKADYSSIAPESGDLITITAISHLQEFINDINDDLILNTDSLNNLIINGVKIAENMFEKGGMAAGENSSYRAICRIRLKEIFYVNNDFTLTINGPNTNVNIYFYTSAGAYVSNHEFTSGSYQIDKNSYVRIMIDGKYGQDPAEMDLTTIYQLVGITTVTEGIVSLTDQVRDLQRSASGIDIPEYYLDNDYIQTKCRAAQLASGVNGITFGFITDIHIGDNAQKSMLLAKYIATYTSCLPFIICGGDIPTTNTGTIDGLYEQAAIWQKMMSQYNKDRVYTCRGNHDYLTNLSSGSFGAANGLCNSYVTGYIPSDVIPGNLDKPYFYVDIPRAATRFIFIDDYSVSAQNNNDPFTGYVGLSPDNYQFLIDALSVNDLKIVVVSHEPLNAAGGAGYNHNLDLAKNILIAFKNHTTYSGSWGATTVNVDFSTSSSDLVCVLSGHKHYDTSSDDGFLNIVTTSDGLYQDDGYNRQVGTTTEQAFDIVTIDYDNRHIHCTRIGAGEDRDFTF